MKTLSILKVFFKLKKDEFLEWINWVNLYLLILTLCIIYTFTVCLPVTIISYNGNFYNWAFISLASMIVLFFIGFLIYGLYYFFKWLINLCKDNWEKATKIVEGK
jgi:hypothetical protein